MNKRLLEIYALSVCFVSMVCLSIFCGILLYTLVEISFPSSMNTSRMYPPSMINQSGTMTAPVFPGQPLSVAPKNESMDSYIDKNKCFQEELERFQKLEFERMHIESMMSMVRSVIIVFISSIVFFFTGVLQSKLES